jgi:hypothetical protein
MLAAGVPIAPGFRAMGCRSEGAEIGLAKSLIKSSTVQNFLDALAAVLAGNAIYYLLMPHLPAIARHRLFREDWGLLVDFAICTVIFAAVKYARRDEA